MAIGYRPVYMRPEGWPNPDLPLNQRAPGIGALDSEPLPRKFVSYEAGHKIWRTMTPEAFKLRELLAETSNDRRRQLNAVVDFFTLAGIKHVASDWDLTALSIHTRGQLLREFLLPTAGSFAPDWLYLISHAANRGIAYSVVSFSDQETFERYASTPPDEVVKRGRQAVSRWKASLQGAIAGEHMIKAIVDVYQKEVAPAGGSVYAAPGPAAVCPKYILGKYPANYQHPEEYIRIGLPGPMDLSKRFHIQWLMKAMSLQAPQLVLIDDDFKNVIAAVADGHYAIWVLGEKGFCIDRVDFFEPFSITHVQDALQEDIDLSKNEIHLGQ